MVLHTVNKSPLTSSCLNTCLRALGADDALLLIEDGVYGAVQQHLSLFTTLPASVKLYALKADLAARGLTPQVSAKIEIVDDAGFVDLVTRFDKSQSWY